MKMLSTRGAVLPLALAPALFLSSCYINLHNGSFSMGLDLGEKAVREETREIAIAGGQVLDVEVPHGDFRLHTSSSGAATLHVKITSHGLTQDAAQHVVDAAKLKIETKSDGVVVRVDDTPVDQEIEGGSMRVTSRFDLDFQLPPGVRLVLTTDSGSIEAVGPFGASEARSSYGKINVSGVEGNLMMRSGSGNVEASGVRGERLEATTGYGQVRLSDCDAKSAIGKSGSGSVHMSRVNADRIEVQSGYGNAELAHLNGNLEARLSSGSIHVEDLAGTKHELRSGYGGVRVSDAKGELDVETSSGSIKITDFDGRLRARSGYGSVNASGVFMALIAESSSGTVDVRAENGSRVDSEWKLRSSYGAVKLAVPRDIACELAASTGYGEIDVGLPIEIAAGALKPGRSVRGKIRGGGQLISLESSSGNVKLYPLP